MNGPSYNAYVKYDVVMKDCVIRQSQGKVVLIDEGYIDNRVNSRLELSHRCLPNIDISNLTIQVGEEVQKAYLFFSRNAIMENKTSRVFRPYRLTGSDSSMTVMAPVRRQTSTPRTSRWMSSQRSARPSRMWT